jgi:hypothetical protein
MLADSAPAPVLKIAFNGHSVTVNGASVRGVYIFSFAREPRGYYTSEVERDVKLADDNADGVVVWTFTGPIPPRSVWFAVDMTSGASAAEALPGYPAERMDLGTDHLKNEVGGEIPTLAAAGSLVDFVVVRPGTGIWSAMVGSRGPADEGAEDGKVTISTFKLTPRLDTAPTAPTKLKKGDVVFIINTFNSNYGIATVGQKS